MSAMPTQGGIVEIHSFQLPSMSFARVILPLWAVAVLLSGRLS